jgi:hypothetical protein
MQTSFVSLFDVVLSHASLENKRPTRKEPNLSLEVVFLLWKVACTCKLFYQECQISLKRERIDIRRTITSYDGH